ncbi:pickpocket protein 19 [Drosophila sulfurigaster albostrigata]|uniref:pickpocket protein 19 n=1 Tax=Drosophila sulfurigaster albostrigata TaxID=89887 RepID=UPI002D218F44|nr:pickpocket protein 19 [Drosophila sulfurigaster albostrigata]
MLLYSKELVAPRAKLSRGLQRFDRHPLRDKYGQMLRNSFAQSSIHGLQNAFEEQHLWVRYFWLIIVLLASVGFLSTYSILEMRHKEQVLVSLVASTQHPVYSIEFPAVAICPWNHVNWMRAATAAERFLPSNANAEMRETFRQLLIGMEQVSFGKFETMGEMSRRNFSSLAKLSLSKLASYLAYRCHELFERSSCVFDETSYDCCQLFVAEGTENGLCLVFNSLISEESRNKKLINEFYPYKISKAGERSGLQFTLRLNDSYLREGTQVPFSMNLMIKQPRQWSQPVVFHLYANTENFVAIDPLLIETSRNTVLMSPSKRHCYFEEERNPFYTYGDPDLPYSRHNCIAVCLQASMLYHCNCTMPLFLPSIEGSRECGVLDIECVYRHADIFGYVKIKGQDKYIKDPRRGQLCDCPHSCNKQEYNMLLNVRELEYANMSRIRTEVYYGQRVITKIETKLQYTFTDWVAGFGGILGLYVGASALSFAELVYVLVKLLWTLLSDGYTKMSLRYKRR